MRREQKCCHHMHEAITRRVAGPLTRRASRSSSRSRFEVDCKGHAPPENISEHMQPCRMERWVFRPRPRRKRQAASTQRWSRKANRPKIALPSEKEQLVSNQHNTSSAPKFGLQPKATPASTRPIKAYQ